MHQPIVTKFLGPTETRGRRVKAKCNAGSLTVDWADNLDPKENHVQVAKELAYKLGWTGMWSAAFLPSGGCVFVMHDPEDDFGVF